MNSGGTWPSCLPPRIQTTVYKLAIQKQVLFVEETVVSGCKLKGHLTQLTCVTVVIRGIGSNSL